MCDATVAVLWPIVTAATATVNAHMYGALLIRPLAWLALAIALAGIVFVWLGLREQRPLRAFLGSSAFLAGLLGATAALLFPVMLRAASRDAESLTAYNSAVPPASLRIALAWWVIAAPLAVTYFVILFRLHRGKAVAPAEVTVIETAESLQRSIIHASVSEFSDERPHEKTVPWSGLCRPRWCEPRSLAGDGRLSVRGEACGTE